MYSVLSPPPLLLAPCVLLVSPFLGIQRSDRPHNQNLAWRCNVNVMQTFCLKCIGIIYFCFYLTTNYKDCELLKAEKEKVRGLDRSGAWLYQQGRKI